MLASKVWTTSIVRSHGRRSPVVFSSRYGPASAIGLALVMTLNTAGAIDISECSQSRFESVLDAALEQGGHIRLLCSTTNQLTTVKVIEKDTTLENVTGLGWLVGIGSNRLFEVRAGATLTLLDLRLVGGQAIGTNGQAGTNSRAAQAGGDAAGGAVLVHSGATLLAEDVLFRSHQAWGGDGGAGANATTIDSPPLHGARAGHARGGAIANLGGVALLTNCLFQSNLATGGAGGAGGSSGTFLMDGGHGGDGGEGSGGAIYSSSNGVLRLVRCAFDDNSATASSGAIGGTGSGVFYFDGHRGTSGPGQGGAVAQLGGRLELQECTFDENSALGADGAAAGVRTGSVSEAAGGDGQPGRGGALYVVGVELDIQECSFTANTTQGGIGGDGGQTAGGGDGGDGGAGAHGQGGAVFISGETEAAVRDSSFWDNEVLAGFGGFGSLGRTQLASSGVDGRPGQGQGGAVHLDTGRLAVSRCLFDHNFAEGAEGNQGPAGTAQVPGSPGQTGGAGLGGGLYNRAGSLGATNSTFHANRCLGGDGGDGGVGTSDAIFPTDGGDGGDGGSAQGAGAWSEAPASAFFVYCTFAANHVVGGDGGDGGASANSGQARDGKPGATGAARGASLAGREAGMHLRGSLIAYPDGGENAAGAVADEGHNVSTDASPLFDSGTSRNELDPLLQALADNGGPTHTMSLASNSPAINSGHAGGAPPVDQRGRARDQQPDLGAFEAGADLPPLQVEVNDGGVLQVSWTADAPGYVLEASSSLRESASWNELQGAALVGDRWVLVLDDLSEQQYYRLSL